MNETDKIKIELLEDEKIEEIETRLKVDDDERWYAPIVRWIVNRYKASREREQNIIDQLKKCREENNALRIVNEALDNFNKAIEQHTKEACFRVVWDYLTPQVWFMGNDQNYFKKEIRQIIDEAKTIS